MKSLASALGLLLLVFGLFFAAQGAGWIPWPRESFMVDTRSWVWYGGLIALAGLALITIARRAR